MTSSKRPTDPSVPRLDREAVAELARALRRPGALLGRRIGAPLREQIILRVSAVNGCAVCAATHEVWGRAVGLDEARVCAIERPDVSSDLDERTRVALRYAELRTRRDEASDPEAVRRLRAQFSRAERREIRAIVDLYSFNNRFNNTWESGLPGAARRRRRFEP